MREYLSLTGKTREHDPLYKTLSSMEGNKKDCGGNTGSSCVLLPQDRISSTVATKDIPIPQYGKSYTVMNVFCYYIEDTQSDDLLCFFLFSIRITKC